MWGESCNRSAVILDRYPLWLAALDRLVVGVGIAVVGRATDGDEAIALIGEHAPDVFIAGITPTNADHIAVVRKAHQVHAMLKCVVVADTADMEAVGAAFSAGASVYCVKTAEEGDLASAIRQAFATFDLHRVEWARIACASCSGGRRVRGSQSDAEGTGDPPARCRGSLELTARADALGHGTDGEVPPVEHLSEARRSQSH